MNSHLPRNRLGFVMHRRVLGATLAALLIFSAMPSLQADPNLNGDYDINSSVKSDPAGHASYIGTMSNKLHVSISGNTVIITGSPPWVNVSGTLDEDGNIISSGSGTVAGYSNVLVIFKGKITSAGLSGDYTMGANEELPDGQPITYRLDGRIADESSSSTSTTSPTTISTPPEIQTSDFVIVPNVSSRIISPGESAQFTLDIATPTGFREDFTLIARAMQQSKNVVIALHPPISVYDETLQGYRDVTLRATPSLDALPGNAVIVIGINYMDPSTEEQIFRDEISRVTINIEELKKEGDPTLLLTSPVLFKNRILLQEGKVQFPSVIVNERDTPQPYTYLVLITDENGYTVFLDFVNGSVNPNARTTSFVDWNSPYTGSFNLDMFLWSSADIPFILAPKVTMPFFAFNNQPQERLTPIVSTRGHFDEHIFDNPTLTKGHTETDYSTIGSIPGINSPCPDEIVIYVHGFQNDEQDAIDNFNTAKKSLEKNGYTGPVIGFSWDSDTGPLDFDDAKMIAEKNGKKLAQFIVDYKLKCPDTKVRLIGHSMGARVILNALQSLHGNATWNTNNWKVATVHVVGAAVDNEEVSKNDGFGNAIEDEVGDFYNKFNYEDNVLSRWYWPEEGDQALGEDGAQKGIPLPSNYHEEDVTKEVGDNHSGYSGTLDRNGNLTDDGIMDKVVDDWKTSNH